MVTYVLGAGASVHAGYPLASNLGSELAGWIRSTKTADHYHRVHIEQISELYGGLANIEEILTDLDECLPGSRASTLPTHVRPYLLSDFRESVREYFNFIREREAEYYRRLAVERVKLGDTLVSFNYDLACERELRRANLWNISDGYGFSLGLAGLESSKVKILKLHGSTNWFGLFFGGSVGFSQFSSVLAERPALFFRRDFEFLGYPPEVYDPQCAGIRQSAGTSAMIMPTLHKRFFAATSAGGREWERFWDDIWAQAEVALQSSQQIVLIGFSMSPVDERARELLLKRSDVGAEVLVFSGSKTDAICREFRSNGFEKVRSFGNDRFEDFLGD